jgi:hypothetical protein
MRSSVSFQSIPVLIDGHDTAGSLVLHEGQLIGVLARLDGEAHQPELHGSWHLEAGFGPCQAVGTHVFGDLDEAGRWFQGRLQEHDKPAS